MALLPVDALFLSCLIVIFLILGLIWHFYIIHTHLSVFPTPPMVPILGHVFDYTDPEKYLEKATAQLIKYGGVIRQYIGPRKPSLVVANRDFLEFLCNNSKYVCKSKFYYYMKAFLGEGLITSDGLKWRSRRRALTGSFTKTSVLKSFVDVFGQKSDILISVLEKYHNEKVNLHPIIKRFTLDVITETAMGVSLNPQLIPVDTKYAKCVETMCEVAQRRMVSFFKNFDFFFQFTDDCLREKQALLEVDTMFEEILERKRRERAKGEVKTRKDMLDLLMEIEIDGQALTHDDLREEINTFTFAGYDTTSSAISLTLYEIGNHPEVQERIFEEQKRLFKDDFKNPNVTYERVQEMDYLEMVIKETLRLHTVVPSIGKRVTKDLKYGDITIPSMLNFSIFIHGFHHNPTYFPEPDKFIPERFADPTKVDNFAYIPFGVKPRQCLGKNFAMIEIKCAISKVIRNFEILKVPEHELKLIPKLVLYSLSGIWVQLKKRNCSI